MHQWALVNQAPNVTLLSIFHKVKGLPVTLLMYFYAYFMHIVFMWIVLMLIKNLFISDADGAHGSTSDKRGLVDVIVLEPRWEWELSNLLDCCDVNQPSRTHSSKASIQCKNFIPELDSKGPHMLALGGWWENDVKHIHGVLLDAREVEEA